MKNTSFIINDSILEISAKPHNKKGEEVYIERFAAKAAAGLHTTLDDMQSFAKANFENKSILSEKTIQEMTNIVSLTKSKRSAQGLGYQIYFLGPITVKGHAGSNTGWEAGIMMNFEDKSAIIMLINSSNGKGIAINTLQKWAKWKMTN